MEEVKCYMPQTLAEALQIRKDTGAQPLAGGSDLMVANSRGAGIVPGFKKPILIISNLPELKGIRQLADGTVEIGALSTSWEIHTSPVTHPLLKGHRPAQQRHHRRQHRQRVPQGRYAPAADSAGRRGGAPERGR